MRHYNILSTKEIKDSSLSKDALQRLIWIDWYFFHGRNAERTCRHFSLSKSVFYRWFNRFDKSNLKSLEFDTKLRRPHHLREMTTPPQILKLIYDIRLKDLSKSKYEIEEELKRKGVNISRKVIQKVINRHFELRNDEHRARLQKGRNYKIARIKAARELREKDLGSLIQIDTKHLYILGQRFYIFVAIDCKSRLVFVYAYKSASSLNAADFLTKVINYFPFKIKAINTDNGPDFKNIGVADEIIKYELVGLKDISKEKGYDTETPLITVNNESSVLGTMLVQLVDEGKIRVEIFPGRSASQVAGFTSNAKIYER